MAAPSKKVGVSTYARVRCFFPDRERLERAVTTKTAAETGGKGQLCTLASETDSVRPTTTSFTDVLGETSTNEGAFGIICMPLLTKVMDGYKALLIAYGQTGSGKTFTLIGAKGPGQLGLLPRSIQWLLQNDKVQKLEMKGFEAYSTGLKKIPLFDLFAEQNQFRFKPFAPPGDDKVKNKQAEYKWIQKKSGAAKLLWKSKSGRTGFDTMNEGEVREINTVADGFRLVDEAHDASHFAKTGKNPESSRGHTVYIVKVKIENPQGEDFSPIATEFIVVDLAGSEGGSTLDALPEGPEKTARFLEGGVINYGLTSLKDMFSEMRKKGKLKQSQGNGLRKLLYPFVTMNTMMSICFALSPSMENVMPTRATMKFAQDACKLKMKPHADTGGKNYQKMYEKLKVTLTEKMDLIEEYEHTIGEGIEHATNSDSVLDDHVGEILTHILEDKRDQVMNLYKDYQLEEYIDDDVLSTINGQIANDKDEYHAKLTKVYQRHDPSRIGQIYDLFDSYMEKGVSIHVAYEIECERYGVTAEKDKKITRTLTVTGAGAEQRKATGLWMENAKLLRQKTGFAVAETRKHMEKMEEMIQYGGIPEENDSHDHVNDLPFNVVDFSAVSHDAHVHHEEQVPEFYQQLSKRKKEALFKRFDANIVHGQMTDEFREELMDEYQLMDDEIHDFEMYMLAKVSQAHDAELVQDYHNDNDTHGISEEDMSVVLDLKHQLHILENEKRVEHSMALWANMRTHLRDRKLQERQTEVDNLKSQLAMSKAQFANMDHTLIESLEHALKGGAGMLSVADVNAKLEEILAKVKAGVNPNRELTVQLQNARAQLMTQEQLLAEIKAGGGSHDMIGKQQELATARLENSRLTGCVDEIRLELGSLQHQINALRQQIFIILHFPRELMVAGRDGFNDNINGVYKLGEWLHDGRVFYKNESTNWVLRWNDEKKLWIFDHRGLNMDDVGSACIDDDVQHPLLTNKDWIIYDGLEFVADSNIGLSGEISKKKKLSKRGPGR